MQKENSLTGIVKSVSPIETVGEKQFRKQIVVVSEQKEQYAQVGAFTFFGKPVEYSEVLKVGDEVTIKFNVSNREYEGKHYPTLNGYFAEVIKSAPVVEEEEDELFG